MVSLIKISLGSDGIVDARWAVGLRGVELHRGLS